MAYNAYNPYGSYPQGSSQAPYDTSYSNTDTYDSKQLPRLPSYTPGEPVAAQPAFSPFQSPFDDAPHRIPSALSFGSSQNPSYYGPAGGREGSPMDYNDDIPLQSQNKGGAHGRVDDFDDHVYDVARGRAAAVPPRQSRLNKWFGGRKPEDRTAWVVWIFTAVQIAVFVGELIKCGIATGIPIQIKPSVNPMIGPSQYILINMGSRYGPCMHNMTGIQDTSLDFLGWPCPNSTTNDPKDRMNQCTLSELCGFNGVPEQEGGVWLGAPNQWFRFITPMFLHAGIVHIGFNMLLQVTLGREMEKEIGSVRFFLVYVSSGIFGFVLGGNFAASGISSAGASGALFGVIALTLLDLLYTWSERKSPFTDLMFIILDIVISFVLGLLPGLDNFSHIGGFVMGLVLGICILHSPSSLRRRIGGDRPPYRAVGDQSGVMRFVSSPLGFFKGRKGAWWAWWLVRGAALIFVLVVFIVLLNNFYIYRKTCGWCKYLSCLPVNGWCELGQLSFVNTTESETTKRDVFGLGMEAVQALAGRAALPLA